MEYSSGKAPNCLENPLNPNSDKTTKLEIIKRYSNHPSIVKIKNSFFDIGLFDFPETRKGHKCTNKSTKSEQSYWT